MKKLQVKQNLKWWWERGHKINPGTLFRIEKVLQYFPNTTYIGPWEIPNDNNPNATPPWLELLDNYAEKFSYVPLNITEWQIDIINRRIIGVTQEEIDRYRKIYDQLDIDYELNRIFDWLSQKQNQVIHAREFILRWFKRSSDRIKESEKIIALKQALEEKNKIIEEWKQKYNIKDQERNLFHNTIQEILKTFDTIADPNEEDPNNREMELLKIISKHHEVSTGFKFYHKYHKYYKEDDPYFIFLLDKIK